MIERKIDKNKKYLFQKRKISFCKKLFENGLNTASYILLSLKEYGELVVENLPSSYPAFAVLKETFGSNSKNKFKKKTIKVNISRLKKQGLVREDEKRKIILSEKGKEMVDYIYDRYSILERPWDERIRVVIFDIPEKKKYLREWFRQELGLLEFKALQKSVFVGKYPLPKSLYQEISKNGLFEQIYVFTIDNIDKEEKLLKLLEE
jgi:DNA-binding transcriptional regulator PaaX